MTYRDRAATPPPHKLLALDGGGIRGALTLEVLAEMETMLREQLGRDEDFVLADWFDYIGGTSTGAIIGAGLACGMHVSRIQGFYERLGPKMFKKRFLPRRIWSKFGAEPLKRELQEEFGKHTTFGDPSLRSFLMVVLKNDTTDSPWPLSNNPNAKFAGAAKGNNLGVPAVEARPCKHGRADVLRARGDRRGDRKGAKGAHIRRRRLTSYNNPAFQLFLMATMDAYKLGWATGEQNLLLVSVGTGYRPNPNENLKLSKPALLHNAITIPSALMFAAQVQQDMLCRVFGRCLVGESLEQRARRISMARTGLWGEKLFTYLRYNAELSKKGLSDLGLTGHRPRRGRPPGLGRPRRRPLPHRTGRRRARPEAGALLRLRLTTSTTEAAEAAPEGHAASSFAVSSTYQVPPLVAEQPPLSAVPVAHVRAVVPAAARASTKLAAPPSRLDATVTV